MRVFLYIYIKFTEFFHRVGGFLLKLKKKKKKSKTRGMALNVHLFLWETIVSIGFCGFLIRGCLKILVLCFECDSSLRFVYKVFSL